MALSPNKAAEIIANAIERNAQRIFVGKDSALMDKLHRLSPTITARLMAKMMACFQTEVAHSHGIGAMHVSGSARTVGFLRS